MINNEKDNRIGDCIMKIAVFYPSSSYNEYPLNDKEIAKLNRLFSFDNVPPKSTSKHTEFMDLISHNPNSVLIAWRGGKVNNENISRSALELINELNDSDYITIKNSHKSIIGLSDVSFLLCSLLNHNIPCFYGPNIYSGFYKSTEKECDIMYNYLEKALNSNTFSVNFLSQDLYPNNTPWVISKGVCVGRVSGGNIDTLLNMNFSETGIKNGDILFLEENDPRYVLKGLKDIKESTIYGAISSILSNVSISGLIIGRSKTPEVFDPKKGLLFDEVSNSIEKDYLELVLNELNINNIPIIANVACGHVPPSFTLPLGRKMCLDTVNCKMFQTD